MRSRTAGMLPLLLLLLAAPSVAACSGTSTASGGGLVSASQAWVRAAPAGGTSAAYVTITNGTLSDDALVGASTPAAGSATLHLTSTADGMVGMHPVDLVAVPAGKTVTLEPGGYHVMLMDLTRRARRGLGRQPDPDLPARRVAERPGRGPGGLIDAGPSVPPPPRPPRPAPAGRAGAT